MIVLFTAFLDINTGHDVGGMTFLDIPISIMLGIVLRAVVGLAAHLFELFHRKGHTIRHTLKTVLLLGISFLLLAIERWLEEIVSVLTKRHNL